MRFVGIDPSTKTGFVALDPAGNILRAKELTGIGDKDPKRMRTLIREVIHHTHPDDVIGIEGFGYASQQAIQLGGIGWGIRMGLDARRMSYIEIAPNQVKKFVNVTGWVGEKGNKKQLKGSEKNKAIQEAVYEHFGFINPSDNVTDAYILARIAREVHKGFVELMDLPLYQREVIHAILYPEPKKKTKRKKAK